jgi:hypothetical protein
MTIILSTKRNDFAVLVADQLIGSQTCAPVYGGKVHLHPTLPLAFAVGSCMWLPVGKGVDRDRHQELAAVVLLAGTMRRAPASRAELGALLGSR